MPPMCQLRRSISPVCSPTLISIPRLRHRFGQSKATRAIHRSRDGMEAISTESETPDPRWSMQMTLAKEAKSVEVSGE